MKKQILLLLATLLVAVGCVPNGISPLPASEPSASPPSSVQETDVVAYVPDVPEQSQDGNCWTNFLNSPYAWSCMIGENAIHEPCLTATDGETIVCGIDPLDESQHFAVNLTEPLPEPDINENADMPIAFSTWLIELEDGVICGLYSGASIGIDGERVNYGCTDEAESQILGDLMPGDVWTAVKVTVDSNDDGFFATSEAVVPLVRVWQPGNPKVASTTEIADALSTEALKNATYTNIYDEPITLEDGVYEGEPFVEGGASRPMVWFIDEQTTFGDIDNDGVDEAVAHLVENSGGSGSFSYLALLDEQAGSVVNTATIMIGDRIELHRLAIESDQIVVEMTTHGPDDPLCCPTQEVEWRFKLQDGLLVRTDE